MDLNYIPHNTPWFQHQCHYVIYPLDGGISKAISYNSSVAKNVQGKKN